MAESSIVVGEIIEKSEIEHGSSPRFSFQKRVDRFPAARNGEEGLSESEAYFHLLPTLPPVARGLYLTSVSGKQSGIDGWLYTITYTKRQGPRIGFLDYSGDSTGKTTKRVYSYNTVAAYSRGNAPIPNNYNGINWNGETFEGVEVPTPGGGWSETWGREVTVQSDSHLAFCRRNTGSYNSAPFRGFEAGEVLFTGTTETAEAVEEDDSYYPMWKITYHFETSPNATGLMVGGIGPIQKRGWDYLWIAYSKSKDDSANRVVGRPEFVYVEQVLPYFDFASLGIGTAGISSLILGMT